VLSAASLLGNLSLYETESGKH